MKHAHKHFGAEDVIHGEAPNVSARHERHAAHRRAARAAGDLHGRPAADAEGPRHQPAGRSRIQARRPPQDQIVLEFTADRRMSVNKQDTTMADLEEKLRTIFEQRKDKTMFIAGAPSLRYGEIVAGDRRRQGRGRREGRHRHRGHEEGSRGRRAISRTRTRDGGRGLKFGLRRRVAGHQKQNGHHASRRVAVLVSVPMSSLWPYALSPCSLLVPRALRLALLQRLGAVAQGVGFLQQVRLRLRSFSMLASSRSSRPL